VASLRSAVSQSAWRI